MKNIYILLVLFWMLHYIFASETHSDYWNKPNTENTQSTNNVICCLLFCTITMSTKSFIVYLVSGFCFAVLSALFLVHNQENPSLSVSSSTSSRYGSGTDKIWPVNFSYFFFFQLYYRHECVNLYYFCVICRNWNQVGNLFWPQ
jgi:hypothetical protein